MIGRITGVVEYISDGLATLDVNGVGYEVATVFEPLIGPRVTLWVHTHVTDDNIALYGFHSVEKRARFRALLKLDGIGPKSALALCASSDEEFTRAAKSSDAKWFRSIKGIGPAAAERIIKSFR